MKPYFCKLIPPRLTFPSDATPSELELMSHHAVYWRELTAQGKAIAAGPVAAPEGAYGVAILKLEDGEDVQSLCEQDPVILGKAGFRWEVLPMFSLIF
jgi:uncharacterized protein YciI